MSFDYASIRSIISIVSFAGAIAAAVYSWWAARNKSTRAALDALDERMDRVQTRVAAAEAEIQYSPSQQEIKELHADIGNLRGDMREITGALSGLRRAVDLMNEHLLNQANRG